MVVLLCPSICPSVYPSIRPYIDPSLSPSLSFYVFFYVFVYLPFYLSFSLSSIRPSAYLVACPSSCPLFGYMYLSIRMSNHPSVFEWSCFKFSNLPKFFLRPVLPSEHQSGAASLSHHHQIDMPPGEIVPFPVFYRKMTSSKGQMSRREALLLAPIHSDQNHSEVRKDS